MGVFREVLLLGLCGKPTEHLLPSLGENLLENYPHYTRTKSSLFLSLRAVLSQMYIGMKHALLASTRALHYDTLS